MLEDLHINSVLNGEANINHNCDHTRDFITPYNENYHYQLVLCDTIPVPCLYMSNTMAFIDSKPNIVSELTSPSKEANMI